MLVEMKSIVMDFGPTRAVNHVSITVSPGTISRFAGRKRRRKIHTDECAGRHVPPHEGRYATSTGKRWR